MSFLNVLTGNSWKGVGFHFLLIITVGFGLIWYFFNGYLPTETRHGEGINMPSIENMPYQQAKAVLEEQGLEIMVRDTVYSPKHVRSGIVMQLPKANKEVKLGRKVYVDINKTSKPTVTLTKAQCQEGGGLLLTDVGTAKITARNLELVPKVILVNKSFKNFVYQAKINGKPIKEGMKIPIGTTIVLITGNGK